MIAKSSRDNYAKIKDSPSIRAKTGRIFTFIKNNGPVTRREIAERLELENGEVAARCKELIDSLKIKEKGYKCSPITGLAVNCLVVSRT